MFSILEPPTRNVDLILANWTKAGTLQVESTLNHGDPENGSRYLPYTL